MFCDDLARNNWYAQGVLCQAYHLVVEVQVLFPEWHQVVVIAVSDANAPGGLQHQHLCFEVLLAAHVE
eukprot:12759594-Prorocentrum_lima.AAC.1